MQRFSRLSQMNTLRGAEDYQLISGTGHGYIQEGTLAEVGVVLEGLVPGGDVVFVLRGPGTVAGDDDFGEFQAFGVAPGLNRWLVELDG